MPYTKFICPDGFKIPIQDCLNGCRIPESECCHISIRKQAAKQREWKGVPSCTQLQKSTLEAYLAITEDYAIKPESATFMLFGTSVHSLIEQDMDRLTSKHGFTGLPDFFDEATGDLVDFKVSSWFTFGETIEKWRQQVNAYRILLEENGRSVNRMRIQVICRDAKLTRGHSYVKWIDVPRQNDQEVIDYFSQKSKMLLTALANKQLPKACTSDERWWNERQQAYLKCKHYCQVCDVCPCNKEAL